WKDAEDVGIAKLDYSNKYSSAYIETMALTPAKIRHQLKTLADVLVPYFSKPANTDVTIGIKKAYESTFADMTVVDDTKRKIVKLKSPSVPDIANPQLKIGFTVS